MVNFEKQGVLASYSRSTRKSVATMPLKKKKLTMLNCEYGITVPLR